MEGCDALIQRCKIKAVEKCTGIWDQFWGHYVMYSTVTSSCQVFENKANGIPASLPFPLEKPGHGEKQGEGMWILFGWETKRQTKEDEADSLWRRLLYCKLGAASVSPSKEKMIYGVICTHTKNVYLFIPYTSTFYTNLCQMHMHMVINFFKSLRDGFRKKKLISSQRILRTEKISLFLKRRWGHLNAFFSS